MDWVLALLLVAGGTLALAPWIVARKPASGSLLERLRHFKSVIGVALTLCGALLLVFDTMLFLPVRTIPQVLANVIIFALGFMLGFPWLQARFLAGRSGREQWAKRGVVLCATLERIQVPLGAAALLVAVYVLLS